MGRESIEFLFTVQGQDFSLRGRPGPGGWRFTCLSHTPGLAVVAGTVARCWAQDPWRLLRQVETRQGLEAEPGVGFAFGQGDRGPGELPPGVAVFWSGSARAEVSAPFLIRLIVEFGLSWLAAREQVGQALPDQGRLRERLAGWREQVRDEERQTRAHAAWLIWPPRPQGGAVAEASPAVSAPPGLSITASGLLRRRSAAATEPFIITVEERRFWFEVTTTHRWWFETCETDEPRLSPLPHVIGWAWSRHPVDCLQAIRGRASQTFEGCLGYAYGIGRYGGGIPEGLVRVQYFRDTVDVTEGFFEQFAVEYGLAHLRLMDSLAIHELDRALKDGIAEALAAIHRRLPVAHRMRAHGLRNPSASG